VSLAGLLAAHPAWLAQLHAAAQRPPAVPRVPLWWQQATIGSVVPVLAERWSRETGLLQPGHRDSQPGFDIRGELTPTLAALADVMRASGVAHAWRDEQLAVADDTGQVLGSVERAVVRPLGIATRAVHLMATTPSGEHWVQQRAHDKPNDPGLWDTLMGGMVSACDTLHEALARETWEEAGLWLEQLQSLTHGGSVLTTRPTGSQGIGYIVEHIDWYRCVLADGLTPVNQDGEVEQFSLLHPEDLLAALLGGAFTLEAALVFAASAR
jgi:8-oxo-dGTP pyrophosphatase MutT (NUDIX family)